MYGYRQQADNTRKRKFEKFTSAHKTHGLLLSSEIYFKIGCDYFARPKKVQFLGFSKYWCRTADGQLFWLTGQFLFSYHGFVRQIFFFRNCPNEEKKQLNKFNIWQLHGRAGREGHTQSIEIFEILYVARRTLWARGSNAARMPSVTHAWCRTLQK